MKTWGKLTLLTLLACLCLAACGEKKTVHKIDWQTAPAYLSEDVALPVETCALNGSCTDGESIYYLTETRTEGARDFQLCRASLSEGTAEPLEQYQAGGLRIHLPGPGAGLGRDAVAVGGLEHIPLRSAGGL